VTGEISKGWGLPHWVYRVYDADGSLLYIGVTRNPTQRVRTWRTQRKNPDAWINKAARWDWRRYPTHFDATEAERYAICAENPPYNTYPLPKYRPGWVAEAAAVAAELEAVAS
jgi:excinuclease UvrABC nuclease subunit